MPATDGLPRPRPVFTLLPYPNLVARLRAGQLTAAEASDASPGYLLLTRHPKLGPARELARRHAARQGRRG